jgi:hypothetical protein
MFRPPFSPETWQIVLAGASPLLIFAGFVLLALTFL